MKDIAIYTLTSELHDAAVVDAATQEFLGGICMDYDFRGSGYADYGSHALSLVYVRTGGTEGIFKRLLPELLEKSRPPFYLLTSGKANSFAASMEILSYLIQHDIKGEIIHGSNEYVRNRIGLLLRVEKARKHLKGCRLGVIGKPSDWLISSNADYAAVKERLGIDIIDIPMQEMLDIHSGIKERTDDELMANAPTDAIRQSIPGALRIYDSLRVIIDKYRLDGFTIRCFDLLTTVHNTGCIALAKLNGEGIVAGCEGDVPAMLSMMVSLALTGRAGFQANPASIDVETGKLLFAHCTIPLNIVDRFEFDTHFKSGIGVGIRGYLDGLVTIFKLSGDTSRHFIAEGSILSCGNKPNLCRTQLDIRLDDKPQARYFLTNPIGNHHIIVPGRHKDELEELLK